MNDAVLSVKEVGYHYAGNAVLEQISFELQRGSFTVLLGPNGAGKSTLISLICRLLESRRGEIRICGVEIRREPEKRCAMSVSCFNSRHWISILQCGRTCFISQHYAACQKLKRD